MSEFYEKKRWSTKKIKRGFHKNGIFIKINLSLLKDQHEDTTIFPFQHMSNASTEVKAHQMNKYGRGDRKPKINAQDEIAIISALRLTHEHDGNFTLKRVQLNVGSTHVHNRTVRRKLSMVRDGYRYCQARHKRLLTKKDLALRLKPAKNIKKHYQSRLWSSDIFLFRR